MVSNDHASYTGERKCNFLCDGTEGTKAFSCHKTLLNSPVHRLYKMDYMKSFVGLVSRHYPTSAMNATQLYTPTYVKLLIPIRCMSNSMNIEDVQNYDN